MSNGLWPINWRKGAISSFESMWSIAQKYSYLNRVPVGQIAIDLLPDKRFHGDWLSFEQKVGLLDERSVAKLLGEPIAKLKFSQPHVYVPNSLLPSRITGLNEGLHWCEKCLAVGFHSYAHQATWLSRCLVHDCSLSSGCPRCGKDLVVFRSTRIDQAAERYQCLCGHMLWPGVKEAVWRAALDNSALEPIAEYCRWVDDLAVKAPIRPLFGGWSGYVLTNRNNYLPEVSWAVRCMASRLEPPEKTCNALAAVPQLPVEVALPAGRSSYKVREVVDQFGLKDLLQSQNTWNRLCGRRPVWFRHVLRVSKELRWQHERCWREVQRLRRALKCVPIKFDARTWAACPACWATVNFESAWMTWQEDVSKPRDARDALLDLDRLLPTGVVEVVERHYVPRGVRSELWTERYQCDGWLPESIDFMPSLRRMLDAVWRLEAERTARECDWKLGHEIGRFAMPFVDHPFRELQPRIAWRAKGSSLVFQLWPRETGPYAPQVLTREELNKHVRMVLATVEADVQEAVQTADKFWDHHLRGIPP